MSRATLSKTSYTTEFNPTSIAGCKLWLDGADATTITGTTSITAWRDKSGSNNNPTFSGTNPSYVAASNAVITANLNQRFTVPAATLATSTGSGSIFMVYGDQQTQGGAYAALFGTTNGGGHNFYQTLIRPDAYSYQFNSSTTPTVAAVANTLNTTNTLLYNMNYTYNSTTGSIRINGTTCAFSFNGSSTPSGALTLSGVGWGDTGNIRIYEVLTYVGATALTISQIQQIEGYLAWKWGLQTSLPPFAGPLSLPSCALWLDGADSSSASMTLSGSSITAWKDKSGNGVSFTIGGTPTLSNAVYNGLSSVYFNGTTNFYNTTFSLNLVNHSFFIVVTETGGGNAGVLIFHNISAGTHDVYSPNALQFASPEFGVQGSYGAQPYSNLSYGVYGDTATPSTSNLILYKNGTSVITKTSLTTTSSTGLVIGSRVYPSSYVAHMTGYVSEVLVYSTALTDTQRQQVEGYLAWKWGTQASLPGAHPYYSSSSFHSYTAAAPIGANLRPALSAALAPTPVRALSKAPYNATFTPTSIAGCAMWYDGADPAGTGVAPAPGTTVTTWIDKSGNANNGTSGTATFQTDSLGGYINFTGSQSYTITNPNIVVNKYFTIFVVEQLQNYGGGESGFMGGTTANGNQNLHMRYYSSGGAIKLGFYGNDLDGSIPAFTNNSTQPTRMWSFAFIANSRTIYVNGTSIASDTNNTQISSWSGAKIGSILGGQPYTGKMREVMIYSGTLTTTQRQEIEGYLAAKWGIQSSLPTFSPTSISGCRLWLDGADATTLSLSGTIVTQWRDKSGNANNTTTIGGSPTYTSNFINLNGSTTYLVGPYVNTTQFLTMFVVVTVNFSQGDYNSYYRLLSIGSTGANDYENDAYASILHAGGTNQLGGYRNRQTNFATVTTNTLFIIAVVYDGTNSTNYINGTSASVVSSTGTFGTSSYSIGRDVGNSFGAYTYWPGTVGEVIVYNASLTATQRQQVEGYLAWKWGLQSQLLNTHLQYTAAPAGHPYATTAPTGASLRPALSVALVPAGVRGLAAKAKISIFTQTFSYTGADQTYVIPAGVTSITLYMWAAGGQGTTTSNGSFYGGAGAYIQGNLTVTPGETLTIYVGQKGPVGFGSAYKNGGFNDTTDQGCGGGGGRSGIARGSTNIIAVGAGGGGGGSGNGGAGGITEGNAGGGTNPGGGGTQTSGGGAGYSEYNNGGGGDNFSGGHGPGAYGGSGGDGYYGGGGGAAYGADQLGGGGGGGSSLTSALTSLVTFVSSNGYSAPNTSSQYYVSGVAAGGYGLSGSGGNGLVIITYSA